MGSIRKIENYKVYMIYIKIYMTLQYNFVFFFFCGGGKCARLKLV